MTTERATMRRWVRKLAYRRHRQMTCKDCWRHFGSGWCGGAMDFLVSTPIWNYVLTGRTRTVLVVREGAFPQHEDGRPNPAGRLAPRTEGDGGVLCLSCFDRRAQAIGIEYRESLIVFGHDCWQGASYEGTVPL